MSSRTERADPLLESFCQELKLRIVGGGELLRDCYRRFEENYAASAKGRRMPAALLIEHSAEAALAHPEPLALLLKSMECMPVKHGPASVIEGVLRLKRTEERDQLLYEGMGLLETLPHPDLISRLANELGQDFFKLPAHVWDRNKSRQSDPRWCRVWGDICHEVIKRLSGKPARLAQEVVQQVVNVIEQAPSPGAEGLAPLTLILVGLEATAIPDAVARRLLDTPAGHVALMRMNSLIDPKDVNLHATVPLKHDTAAPVSSVEQRLTRLDFPEEPQNSLFQLWTALGATLQGVKEQTQRIRELEAIKHEMATRLGTIEDEAVRLREKLVSLQRNLQQERDKGISLLREQEALALKAVEAAKERDRVNHELQAARDAYIRLDGQAVQEKSSQRDQMLTDLLIEVRQPCEDMAEMLGMALHGEKKAGDVARMWNRLDETLARSLGRTHIAPVEVPGR